MVVLGEVFRMQPQSPLYHYYTPPHRDPPPYPGHYSYNTPGYRQSYSGSETSTDISLSSTENLSTCARQDPQGEETAYTFPGSHPDATAYHLPGLSVDSTDSTSSLVTTPLGLPPVQVKSANNSTFYVTASRPSSSSPQPEASMTTSGGGLLQQLIALSSAVSTTTSTSYPSTTCSPIAAHRSSPVASPAQSHPQKSSPQQQQQSQQQQQQQQQQQKLNQQQQQRLNTAAYAQELLRLSPQHVQAAIEHHYNLELTSAQQKLIQDQLQKQQQNLQFLELQQQNLKPSVTTPSCEDKNESRPPPQYPGVTPSVHTLHTDLCHSYEMLCDRFTRPRSQPDLTCLPDMPVTTANATTTASNISNARNGHPTNNNTKNVTTNTMASNSQNTSPSCVTKKKVEFDPAAVATRASQMVERLSEENRSLRQELEGYYKKVTKLQKFEMEIQKVNDAYEALVKQSQKRENLEKIMRFKLEAEIKKLKDTNKELKDQLDKALNNTPQKEESSLGDSEVQQELSKKDSIISKLIGQNKELTAGKERLEIEVAAQRATLQEQRSHINVLDNALANTQTTIMKLEDEVRKKHLLDDRVEELQHSVAQLQKTAEKREDIEQKLRAHLQEDIRNMRSQPLSTPEPSEDGSDKDSVCEHRSNSPKLSHAQQLRERDQRILELEAHVVKWEQKYLEENAMRQLAVDAASVPKDVRIAALEKNSSETEKILAESRTERLKHLEEVYQANRKTAQLESKVKTLQAQLAEKDAMISVLQRHSSLSRTSSVTSLFCSPLHSPRPSYTSLSPVPTVSLSSPPSAGSSRQNSNIETTASYKTPAHSKSNSTGSSNLGSTPSSSSPSKEAQIRELQQKIAAQTALFRTLQSHPDQVSKCLWQV